MSQSIHNLARYPLNLTNVPGLDTNPIATEEEQANVFLLGGGTGIHNHGYNGMDSAVGMVELYGLPVGNPGSLVVAPSQSNSGSNIQQIQLATGQNVEVSRKDGVISAGNELVPGGLGMSPNILLNLPSSDGTYYGRPVWNYSSMEIIDALPAYQGPRAHLLDRCGDIIDSGEYDFFLISLPANNLDAVIAWKDTYRTQLSVPPGSLLVMILGDWQSGTPI